jgi:hypothetical protein
MPFGPLESGSESHEGPVLERAIALGLGSLALLNATIAGAVLLDFINIISAILLSMTALLLSTAIAVNGIRNMSYGYKVIEVEDE